MYVATFYFIQGDSLHKYNTRVSLHDTPFHTLSEIQYLHRETYSTWYVSPWLSTYNVNFLGTIICMTYLLKLYDAPIEVLQKECHITQH